MLILIFFPNIKKQKQQINLSSLFKKKKPHLHPENKKKFWHTYLFEVFISAYFIKVMTLSIKDIKQ